MSKDGRHSAMPDAIVRMLGQAEQRGAYLSRTFVGRIPCRAGGLNQCSCRGRKSICAKVSPVRSMGYGDDQLSLRKGTL
jgi:hypothetical protein